MADSPANLQISKEKAVPWTGFCVVARTALNENKENENEETKKKEDENCTSSFSSSTIPLTSGIEEAPQLLLSVNLFLPHYACQLQAPSEQAC